jgi:hypothetical protein
VESEKFMFQLTKEEWDSLRFQIGILETGRGKYTKFLPHAFTEQGLAMLSGVLNSEVAIDVNITIMRAFVSLRRVVSMVKKEDLIEMKKDTLIYIDDEIYVTYEYDYGDDIVPEAEPTKEGFIFSGWSKVPATMPNSNVRVTGSFAVDAIESVIADDSEYQIFTIDGAPIETLQKGVNIIKYKNGTSKKIVVK